MNKNISIDNIEEIGMILDIIHDRFFDIDDIVFSSKESCLIIKFEKECEESKLNFFDLFKKTKKDIYYGFLRFNYVNNYKIIDTEKVGRYDFNKIIYNSKEKTINIITCIPLYIILFVDKLSISVSIDTEHRVTVGN